MSSIIETEGLHAATAGRIAQRMQMQLAILADAGFPALQGAKILDLGCGNGNLVAEYRRAGFQAYGCDLAFKPGPNVEELSRKGYIRLVDPNSYRLPFDDREFDFVLSNEVFEHVQDYGTTLAEHRRVLKSSGAGLHFIPSRHQPIEPHVYVPLATMIQSYWWLRLWAQLGVHMKEQRGVPPKERARRNTEYLRRSTNYLSKAQIGREFGRHFAEVRYVEHLFLKYSRRAHVLHTLSALIPIIPNVYSRLRSHVVLCSAPIARLSRQS
jgi:ubiquinone/menaquinone biosynthesis C-methylase UbiE